MVLKTQGDLGQFFYLNSGNPVTMIYKHLLENCI